MFLGGWHTRQRRTRILIIWIWVPRRALAIVTMKWNGILSFDSLSYRRANQVPNLLQKDVVYNFAKLFSIYFRHLSVESIEVVVSLLSIDNLGKWQPSLLSYLATFGDSCCRGRYFQGTKCVIWKRYNGALLYEIKDKIRRKSSFNYQISSSFKFKSMWLSPCTWLD